MMGIVKTRKHKNGKKRIVRMKTVRTGKYNVLSADFLLVFTRTEDMKML